MHAIVGTVEIEARRGDEAVTTLKNQVVPFVMAMPGFVSGTWARSADGTKGYSIIIFESAEAAESAMARARVESPEAPVKMLHSEAYEVVAQA